MNLPIIPIYFFCPHWCLTVNSKDEESWQKRVPFISGKNGAGITRVSAWRQAGEEGGETCGDTEAYEVDTGSLFELHQVRNGCNA